MSNSTELTDDERRKSASGSEKSPCTPEQSGGPARSQSGTCGLPGYRNDPRRPLQKQHQQQRQLFERDHDAPSGYTGMNRGYSSQCPVNVSTLSREDVLAMVSANFPGSYDPTRERHPYPIDLGREEGLRQLVGPTGSSHGSKATGSLWRHQSIDTPSSMLAYPPLNGDRGGRSQGHSRGSVEVELSTMSSRGSSSTAGVTPAGADNSHRVQQANGDATGGAAH